MAQYIMNVRAGFGAKDL